MSAAGDRRQLIDAALLALRLIVVPCIAIGAIAALGARREWQFGEFDLVRLLAAIALTELSLWLVSLRLSQLLAMLGAKLPVFAAFRITLSSLFYYLAIPTSAGMEAARFLRIRSAVPTTDVAVLVSTLLLDRLIGAASSGIVLLAAVIVLAPDTLTITPGKVSGVALAALLVVAALVTLVHVRPERLEPALRIGRLLMRNWRALAVCGAFAVAIQLVTVLAVHSGVRAFGLDVSLPAVALGVMAGTVLMMIPISFAGLGPGEVAGAVLLMAIGVHETAAAMVMFIAYAGRVFAGLQGAAIEIYEGGTALRRA